MKKIIISIIIVMQFTSQIALAFSDVDDNTSYENSITWMSENGVINGYPDGSFKPKQCVNRVEMLKLLMEMQEIDVESYEDNTTLFPDTSKNEWYAPYVIAGRAEGIIKGYPDGTFKPGQCVNRVEAIKMAMESFNVDEYSFDGGWDWADIESSEWYFKYAYAALDMDILGLEHVSYKTYSETGLPYNHYYPAESMSRQEVAEMLYRIKIMIDNAKDKYDSADSPNAIESSQEPEETAEIIQKISEYCVEHNIPECSIGTSYYVVDDSDDKYRVVRVSGFNYLLTKTNSEWDISIVSQEDNICDTGSDNADLVEYCSN
jgi:hypothetical protein